MTTFASNFGAGRLKRGIHSEYPALACLHQNSLRMSSHVAPLLFDISERKLEGTPTELTLSSGQDLSRGEKSIR